MRKFLSLIVALCLSSHPISAADITLEAAPASFKSLYPVFEAAFPGTKLKDGWPAFAKQPAHALRLTGQIVPGDAARLRKAAMSATKNGHYGAAYLVMSDSPGGSFKEALTIGKAIYQAIYVDPDGLYAGVLVEKGARCESACALIAAMAGRRLFVEPGARLGFHLPFFSPDLVARVNAGPSDVERVMDITYDISLGYTEMALHGMATPWLIRQAYRHRDATTFFYPRTAEDIWKAGFTPVAPLAQGRAITVQHMRLEKIGRLCNAAFARSPLPKTKDDEVLAEFVMYKSDRFGALPNLIKQTKRSYFRISAQDPDASDFSCVFGLDSKARLHLEITKARPKCRTTYAKDLPLMCAIHTPTRANFVTKYALDAIAK